MAKKENKKISSSGRGRPRKVQPAPTKEFKGRGRPQKNEQVISVQLGGNKHKDIIIPKRVEQGKMSIDTEQMLKDLIELGRIKPEEDKNKNRVKDSWELPKSPLSNFIDRNNSFYVKIASVFTIIVIMFFVSVLYVTNSKAIINIGLKNVDTNGEIKKTINIFSQKDSADNNNIIAISVDAKVNINDIYSDIESKDVSETVAVGKIKITNKLSSPRDLVETTRFISDKTSNLYRLKNTVRVPANSFIIADVYADNKEILGDDINVRFTIPGLRDELKADVYGESVEAITVKTVSKKIVKEEDIKNAADILDVKLKQAAINKLKEQIKDIVAYEFIADSFDYKISNKKTDAKVGDVVDSIKTSATIEASGIFVNKAKILDLAKTNILSRSLAGSTVKIKEDSLDYQVENLDLIKNQMVLKILVDFSSSYNIDSLLDRNDIAGMSINDFYSYVAQKNFATRVNVVSYPFWNSKLPTITDNIIIKVK